MPAIGNLVLNNGEATPVAKTFTPEQIDSKGVARYADNSGGISIGAPTIAISNRKQANGGHRVRLDIAYPVLEAAAGTNAAGFTPADQVAYTCRSNHEFILPARCSKSDREDVIAFAKNLLSDAVAEALVEDLENVY